MAKKILFALLLPALVSAQAQPAFEVASIRPSAPQGNDVTVGVRITGSQIRISNWPLREYVAMAYRIRPQQISGPESLTQQSFDIAATIPDGVAVSKVPEMLQALLANRFQLKARMEKKEFPVYALAVAKDGLKIKELPPDPALDAAVRPVTDVVAAGSGNGVVLDLGAGSSFALANNRIEVRKMRIEDLAGLITRFLDRAVIDETGLTGRYDMTLELTPEDYTAMMLRAAIGAGVQLPPQAFQLLNAGSGNPLKGPLERIGLTFDARNAALDYLVVESVLKTPTDN